MKMAIDYWQYLEPGKIYHFYNRAINKDLLFRTDKDYSLFLKKTKKYLAPYLHFYAYCLIPNHFHFLFEVMEIDDEMNHHLLKEKTKCANHLLNGNIELNSFLEDQFRRLFSSHALYFNKFYNRKGSLFQKRPKRIAIESIERLLYQICYIHHNPIHHHLRNDFHEWKYSSYNSFISEKPFLIERKKVVSFFWK